MTIIYVVDVVNQSFACHYGLFYERIIQDLPRLNNVIEDWHHAFDNPVSIKHPSISKLVKYILREQSRFETNIERLRAGEQAKKRKKVYANLKVRLNRIASSYDVNSIEEYST